MLGLRGGASFSLVASSQDHSLDEMCGLIVVASLVAEHKVLRLWSSSSIVVVPGLSCSVACGIFPGRD